MKQKDSHEYLAGSLRTARTIIIRHGLTERPCVAMRAKHSRRMFKLQMRKHQLRHTVRFLKMRVAGENEILHAHLHILMYQSSNLLRVADKCGSGAAAHQPDASP